MAAMNRMNPAFNGSKPLDLQDVTPSPAPELQTPRQGLRTPAQLAPNPTYRVSGVALI